VTQIAQATRWSWDEVKKNHFSNSVFRTWSDGRSFSLFPFHLFLPMWPGRRVQQLLDRVHWWGLVGRVKPDITQSIYIIMVKIVVGKYAHEFVTQTCLCGLYIYRCSDVCPFTKFQYQLVHRAPHVDFIESCF
jgi:hypothetical protein